MRDRREPDDTDMKGHDVQIDATQVWSHVHHERAQLVADLRDRPPADFEVASLCTGWDVHDVLAHLVDTAKCSRLRFVRDMIGARGNFDTANAAGITRERRPDPRDTVHELDRVRDDTRTPPAAIATRLVEAFVHGEDIRRPLGIRAHYPGEAVAEALDYQCRTSASIGGSRDRVTGLALVADDSTFTFGAGAQVSGHSIDLLLAISGRSVPADALVGPGVERLMARR